MTILSIALIPILNIYLYGTIEHFKYMKLTKKALQKIKEPAIRMRIAVALGVTDQAVIKYIKRNSDNLTKAAALQIIRDETGLKDSEILTEEVAA